MHTYAESPEHDAYLWQILDVDDIPTLTIHSVVCINPAKSTDAAGDVLLEIVGNVLVAARVVLELRHADVTMEEMLEAGSAGALLRENMNKRYGGEDDLYINVDHIKRWPCGDSLTAISQVPIDTALKLPYDPEHGFLIELMEYDKASGDDGLGWKQFTPDMLERLQPDVPVHYMLANENEGSVYKIKISIGQGLTGH